MSKDSNEWIHNWDNPIMISGIVFQELCIARQSFVYDIIKDKNNYLLQSGFQTVKFSSHDITVYLYLLQNLGEKSQYTLSTGYEIGEQLKYTIRDHGSYKECQKVSASIERLKRAGYLVHLPSYHKGKIIPLVRLNKGKHYDKNGGFQNFVNSTDKAKAFAKYGNKDAKYEPEHPESPW